METHKQFGHSLAGSVKKIKSNSGHLNLDLPKIINNVI